MFVSIISKRHANLVRLLAEQRTAKRAISLSVNNQCHHLYNNKQRSNDSRLGTVAHLHTTSPHLQSSSSASSASSTSSATTKSSSATVSSSKVSATAKAVGGEGQTRKTINIADSDIKKSVFISQSYDIFTNLALEDWLYKNFDFSHHHVLLLWANDPCVVIGRHQNPFTEANVSKIIEKGITLARRNSGGGAVYHDRGNLNCTFFTPRERYNRKYNLNILTRALFREWAIKAEINKRDDIVIDGKKISGTAAKLGHPNAYHHCTLLTSANKHILGEALIKEDVNYVGKATSSIPSPIRNLCDVNRSVNVAQLLSAVGYEFLRTSATELCDGGSAQAMQQRGFQLINPTEKWFPGINEIKTEFSSWQWIFGRTPTFNVEKELSLKADEKQHKIKLNVTVEGGLMTDIGIVMPNNDRLPVVSALQSKPYNEKNLNGIINALKHVSTENVMQAINGSI